MVQVRKDSYNRRKALDTLRKTLLKDEIIEISDEEAKELNLYDENI